MFVLHSRAPKLYIAIEIPNDKEALRSSALKKLFGELLEKIKGG
jgi:hypothetical protein